jgi:hypothetical protein
MNERPTSSPISMANKTSNKDSSYVYFEDRSPWLFLVRSHKWHPPFISSAHYACACTDLLQFRPSARSVWRIAAPPPVISGGELTVKRLAIRSTR